MRWFTCTPVNFLGNEIFFSRDSGLMSLGLKAVGLEGRAISLAPAREGDWPALIRATLSELESADWWRTQQLDGVVFYSWGVARYQKIADAIVSANVRLVHVCDTHGIFSPLSDWKAHVTAAWSHQWYDSQLKKFLRTLAKLPYSHTLGILRQDLPIARMIDTGDFFLAATPAAAARFRRFIKILRGAQAADKVRMLPLPVHSHFCYAPSVTKEELVVAVGRWDHPQKRAGLLMHTIRLTAQARPATRFVIFGKVPPPLAVWHAGLPESIRSRVNLAGVVTSQQLAQVYQRARVMLVSAAYEGCHNASAEAVCCGCSVVAVDTPFMAALAWHASKKSGLLATHASPRALAHSLCDELAAWENGERHPELFGPEWADVFHPDKVALRILELFGIPAPLST